MDSRIAFLGMGGMGQAITTNLAQKANLSHPLILYNRTRERAEEHAAHIGHSTVVADGLEEAVSKADIIWSCVQDQAAVEQLFAEILTRDVRGRLFVESSTVLPEVTNRIAAEIGARGGEFVAMPVFGDPTVARISKLVCIPAGPTAAVQRIRPYLKGIIAQAVIDLSGEAPGQASLLKIIGNVMVMSTMEMVAEINVFAEKTGLGTKNAQKLVKAFPKAAGEIYCDRMMDGEYYNGKPMVEVAKARLLTSEVLNLAKASNVSLPSYSAAVNHLAVAEEHSGPKSDITGIYGAVRIESGLDFRNEDANNRY